MTTVTRLNPLYPVKLIVDGRSHFYQVGTDEAWKPGVTTVLSAAIPKPALLPWALNMMADNVRSALMSLHPSELLTETVIESIIKEGKDIYKKKSAEATDIGGRVHQAIDRIVKGEQPEPSYLSDIGPAIHGFLDWKASHSLTIELGDTKIGSKLFGYGGSLDMVAFDGDEPIIFDFKTNKKRKDRDHGIYPETAYQLAAYAQAFQETYGLPVKAVYALWLNKEKPEFKAVKISNIQACFEGFLAALKLYNLSKWEKFEETI